MEQMGNSYLFFEIKRENIKVPLGEEARMVLQVKKKHATYKTIKLLDD